MKPKLLYLLFTFAFLLSKIHAQNVGIGTATPASKLHIKGSIDTTQLIIDANSTQSNAKPLIKLRKSDGTDLLWIHSDDSSNIFIGRNAGRFNNVTAGGNFNSFVGSRAGYSNIGGNYNSAFGASALFSNSTGNYNTANGFAALTKNTSGELNTANGYAALYNNTTGVNNTATGLAALYANTTGIENTANGVTALYNNTTGKDNTAVGMKALHENTTANYNTAIGAYALFVNILGYENTATGTSTLSYNTTGNRNTATGHQALYANTIGIENTASGAYALRLNTTGNNNTAAGLAALLDNDSGNNNTAIGNYALGSNFTGNNNVGIGYDCSVDLANSNQNTMIGASAHVSGNNDVAIGFNSFTNVNNLALLGSTTTTLAGGYANWSIFSDGRFKTSIDENVKGLDFILRLRPVTYHMDVRAIYKLWGQGPLGIAENKMTAAMKTEMDNSIKAKEAIRMSGFIAQEVEKAAAESGYDFDGVIKPAHDKDHYRLAYGEFVVPLVKAVKEQQQIIERLEKRIEELEKKIGLDKNKRAD